MDGERFYRACKIAEDKLRSQGGIGTLGERTLHVALKYYFDLNEAHHEVKIGRFVADIASEDCITEIQTTGLYRLSPKLESFLPISDVTVVHPIATEKYVSWTDPQTGEVLETRKSPKKGRAADVLPQLYGIRNHLGNPSLTVCVILLTLHEYKVLRGSDIKKKRGSARFERIPLTLVDEIYLRTPGDYVKTLPPLPEKFDSAEYARAVHCSRRDAATALLVLTKVGAVERIGMSGRSIIYRLPENTLPPS